MGGRNLHRPFAREVEDHEGAIRIAAAFGERELGPAGGEREAVDERIFGFEAAVDDAATPVRLQHFDLWATAGGDGDDLVGADSGAIRAPRARERHGAENE